MRVMRPVIRTLERLHRVAVRAALALEVDAAMLRCPGCDSSDRYGLKRVTRRLPSRPVRLGRDAIVMACVAHAPFVSRYSVTDAAKVVRCRTDDYGCITEVLIQNSVGTEYWIPWFAKPDGGSVDRV
jgi:hypothetical protein